MLFVMAKNVLGDRLATAFSVNYLVSVSFLCLKAMNFKIQTVRNTFAINWENLLQSVKKKLLKNFDSCQKEMRQ